ncbi:hypothetical protein [Kineosporia babensis]|uniref:Uncharacterized protein n=1 Tax=Kineosporia babensis TaxID=499548 RepID=A0A9X1SSP5_9ACTN|nr:hypothetical protein [Kineosporia babensis]MCD5310887.1 hypothetical protein [Kineosporia babensis]
MSAVTYRKQPVEIQAIRYTGTNHDEVNAFTGQQDGFHAVAPEDRSEWDFLHSTWVGESLELR